MKNPLRATLGLAALLAGCGQSQSDTTPERAAKNASMEAPMSASAPPPSEESTKQDEATADVTGSAKPQPMPIAVPSARLLIYHAELRLKVQNPSRASASLDSLVQRHGGYVSGATETREEGEWRQAMTIRVLPSHFRPLMAALRGVGTIENKKLTTDDVTAEHADVAARLRTKRAVEQRYVALLDRARKISEILEIESKIGEVREEIESTESRLKTLNDEVGYSTISVTCYQPLPQDVPDAPIVSFGSRFVESFYTGWTLITSFLIGVVAIWPFLLLGGATWWGVRRWRHRRASKQVLPE